METIIVGIATALITLIGTLYASKKKFTTDQDSIYAGSTKDLLEELAKAFEKIEKIGNDLNEANQKRMITENERDQIKHEAEDLRKTVETQSKEIEDLHKIVASQAQQMEIQRQQMSIQARQIEDLKATIESVAKKSGIPTQD